MYQIKEIFKSIQGEGYNTGVESVFIRFTGCNFWNGKFEDRSKAICNFCDTDFIGTDGCNGGKYNLENLVQTVERVWNSSFSIGKKNIILTGGEPLLQVDDNLVKILKKKKYKVSIETNGSLETRIDFDWICVSPKDQKHWHQKTGDELKIIFPQTEFNLKELLKLDFKYFFLQPKDDKLRKLNLNKTIDYCKLNREWIPSLQLHKSFGIK
tara:strand:- start:1981 stop:2613 length:633 start_codon:yes stop_codon:yes gene_type:complete